MNRRKLKKERELAADIRKTFMNFCKTVDSCTDCRYDYCPTTIECMISYVTDLISQYEKEEDIHG